MKTLALQEVLVELLTYLHCASNFVNLMQDFQCLPLAMKGVVHSYVSRMIEMGYVSRVIEMFLQEQWL